MHWFAFGQVWRVHWGHFKTKSEETGPPQWFHFGKEDALFYGFPAKDGLAKVRKSIAQ